MDGKKATRTLHDERTKRYLITLRPSIHDKAAELASKAGMSMSAYISMLIEKTG